MFDLELEYWVQISFLTSISYGKLRTAGACFLFSEGKKRILIPTVYPMEGLADHYSLILVCFKVLGPVFRLRGA